MNELIQEVLELADRELSQNRVLLECELTKTLPNVLGDRVQLQQVLMNLIIKMLIACSIRFFRQKRTAWEWVCLSAAH